MATLATQLISTAGLTPAYAAANGGGDNFTPDVDTFIHVKNGGGSPITVTIPIVPKYKGQSVSSISVSVPNAGEKMIDVGDVTAFADTTNAGLGAITYSGVTSVTIGVFKNPPVT